MRILNGVLCVILLFFAALQVNDPDALLWIAIYAVAAIWPGIAAAKPELLATKRSIRMAGMVAIAGCIVGFLANAGTIDSNWIQTETAREAFGYLINAAVITFALYATRPTTSSSPA